MKTLSFFSIKILVFIVYFLLPNKGISQGFFEIYDDLNSNFNGSQFNNIINTSDNGFLIFDDENHVIKSDPFGNLEWEFNLLGIDTVFPNQSFNIFENTQTGNYEIIGIGSSTSFSEALYRITLSDSGNFIQAEASNPDWTLPYFGADKILALPNGTTFMIHSEGTTTILSSISNTGILN